MHPKDPKSWNYKLDPPERIDQSPKCDACGRTDVPLTATPVGQFCAEHAMDPAVLHERVKELDHITDSLRARVSELESQMLAANANIADIVHHLKQVSCVEGAPVSPPVSPADVPPHPAPSTSEKTQWVNHRRDYGNGVTASTFVPINPGENAAYWINIELNGNDVESIYRTPEQAEAACDAFIAAVRGEVTK